MEVATYATSSNVYRMHVIFTLKNLIVDFYWDMGYYQEEMINQKTFISSVVHGVRFVSTVITEGSEKDSNSYLYALSVANQAKPEYHIYIVSDVVSWVKKVPLLNITQDGFKVEPSKGSVTYIEEQDVFIVKAYKEEWLRATKTAFYFYKVNGTNLTIFDKVTSEETSSRAVKFVYINDFLYYIIYKGEHYVDVYSLNTKLNRHYIEYRLGIEGDSTFLTGHS